MRTAIFMTPIAILMAGSAMAAEADLDAAAKAESKAGVDTVVVDEDAPKDLFPRPEGETNTVLGPVPGAVVMSPEHMVEPDEAEVRAVEKSEAETEGEISTGSE